MQEGMDKKNNVTAAPPMSEEDAMERLAQVMNDSPTLVKLGEAGFSITALKPATQWLIAEEAIKIQKAEKANFADVIKQFATSYQSVITVLTLAILNDRDRIYKNPRTKEFSDEYFTVRDTIEWETNPKYWMNLLVEVINLLSLDFFFNVTDSIMVLKEMALKRKMTMKELKSSQVVQNGVR